MNLLWARRERSLEVIPGVISLEICKKLPGPKDGERQWQPCHRKLKVSVHAACGQIPISWIETHQI